MELVRRLWRGDLPLWQTFWGFAIFGHVAVVFVILFISKFLVDPASGVATGANDIVVRVLGFGGLAYLVLVCAAVWRSSDKYGGPRLWAIVAKIWVIFAAISSVAGTFNLIG